MKKIITLTLLLIIMTTGCTINRVVEEDVDGLKPIIFNDNEEISNQVNQTNLINQEKQMIQNNNQLKSEDKTTEFALIKTNLGDIKIKLYVAESPISVENFKKYINSKFYDSTIFHRVIDGFMIQGGGFDATGMQKETLVPIKNEAKNGVSNKRGTIAMARTMEIDSATAQFFINLVDNVGLDYKDNINYGYAVFGEVVEGMDIVDKIAKVKTKNNGMYQDWPVEDVVINSMEMVE